MSGAQARRTDIAANDAPEASSPNDRDKSDRDKENRKASLFARKGTAAPLVDKQGGAEAPEEVVAENKAARGGASVDRLTIINERSVEAGYPQNPSPEELAALDAEREAMEGARGGGWMGAANVGRIEGQSTEDWGALLAPGALREDEAHGGESPADEIRSRQSNAGAERLTGDGASTAAAIIGLGLSRETAQAVDAAGGETARALLDSQASAVASLPLRQYLRLKIAAAGLSMSEEEIIRRALAAYLDRCAIDDLSDCKTLVEAAARCQQMIGR